MTTIPSLTFGPRQQASTSSRVFYDVELDGNKVGELERGASGRLWSSDKRLTALGVATAETTADKAKRDLNACWRSLTDGERALVAAIADVAWTPAPDDPAGVDPAVVRGVLLARRRGAAAEKPAPVEPAAEKPAGKLTQEWIDSEPGCSKGDGLNGLRLSFENGKNYYYLSVVKGRKKTLGNAKRGHPKWISLEEARDRACARLAGVPA